MRFTSIAFATLSLIPAVAATSVDRHPLVTTRTGREPVAIHTVFEEMTRLHHATAPWDAAIAAVRARRGDTAFVASFIDAAHASSASEWNAILTALAELHASDAARRALTAEDDMFDTVRAAVSLDTKVRRLLSSISMARVPPRVALYGDAARTRALDQFRLLARTFGSYHADVSLEVVLEEEGASFTNAFYFAAREVRSLSAWIYLCETLKHYREDLALADTDEDDVDGLAMAQRRAKLSFTRIEAQGIADKRD